MLVSQVLCRISILSPPVTVHTWPHRSNHNPSLKTALTLPCPHHPPGSKCPFGKAIDVIFLLTRIGPWVVGPLYCVITISWATSSGVSFSKSKVNSMAPLSLGLPFSFLGSSTQSRRAMVDFLPWSSSASSTRTPVSSAKKAWLSRSLISYLEGKCLPGRAQGTRGLHTHLHAQYQAIPTHCAGYPRKFSHFISGWQALPTRVGHRCAH